MGKSFSIGLFERLPGDVFRPFTGPNRNRMWQLVTELYDTFFGPDASTPPEDGHISRAVTQQIEHFLLKVGEWEAEGEDPATPISIRANALLRRLIDCGWLREERRGVRMFISMDTICGQFLEVLRTFAEDGPIRVGAKVRVIHSTLKDVLNDPYTRADAFSEAAKMTRDLVSSLNAINVSAKTLIADLAGASSVSQYVRAFFEEYVNKLFIGDYNELKTLNHPLQNRDELLDAIATLRDDSLKHEALLAGYRKMLAGRDEESIQSALDRDFSRLRKFEDIQIYLDRLDRGMGKTAQRALSYISYKLRTQDDLDRLICSVAEDVAAITDDSILIGTPWPAGALFSEQALREPTLPPPPRKRITIVKKAMTLEERARWEVDRQMARNRQVTPVLLQEYITHSKGDRNTVSSDHMPIASVADLVRFGTLARYAWTRSLALKGAGKDELERAASSIRLTAVESERTANQHLDVPKFVVTVRKQQ